MKVHIDLTLNIDPDAWTTEYGVVGAAEIRRDVQDYVRNAVLTQLQEQGLLKEELPATTQVPCRLCGGLTIPPDPRRPEEFDFYCEACGTTTEHEGGLR